MADTRNGAYAHEGHLAHNERLKRTAAPKQRDLTGQWLSNEAVMRLPRLRRDFEDRQSPINQSSHDRSGAQTAHGSAMVRQDNPYPAPHPTGPLGEAVDRQAFKDRWLVEQRDAALTQTTEHHRIPEPARDLSRASQEPSR